MNYRLTPLNIFCAFLVAPEIVLFAFPEILKNEHYRYQYIYIIPVILIGFLADYFLQRLIKKYFWLFIIEIVSLWA